MPGHVVKAWKLPKAISALKNNIKYLLELSNGKYAYTEYDYSTWGNIAKYKRYGDAIGWYIGRVRRGAEEKWLQDIANSRIPPDFIITPEATEQPKEPIKEEIIKPGPTREWIFTYTETDERTYPRYYGAYSPRNKPFPFQEDKQKEVRKQIMRQKEWPYCNAHHEEYELTWGCKPYTLTFKLECLRCLDKREG